MAFVSCDLSFQFERDEFNRLKYDSVLSTYALLVLASEFGLSRTSLGTARKKLYLAQERPSFTTSLIGIEVRLLEDKELKERFFFLGGSYVGVF